MSASRLYDNGITRRRWTALLAVTPLVTQVTSTSPPVDSAATPKPSSTPEQHLDKAASDIRQMSERLRQIQIPMSTEPAFSFKA